MVVEVSEGRGEAGRFQNVRVKTMIRSVAVAASRRMGISQDAGCVPLVQPLPAEKLRGHHGVLDAGLNPRKADDD